MNLILRTDSYKASHFKQYPPGTNALFSYIEARNKKIGQDFSVFFGLQAILEKYLSAPITARDVLRAENFFRAHGEPFDFNGWVRVVEQHGGFLPIRIRAIPEGTVIHNGNALVTVESTDPELPGVGSYIENVLLRVWYPTTVATRSFQSKLVIRDALERTADTLDGLPFKLHDFGSRGVSSGESAELGGMAHLVNFLGSDTVEGVVGAMEHYGDGNDSMLGFSPPAAEHSTITSWGRENEVEAYRNMIRQFGGEGKVFAVVSDSYDIYNACESLWGEQLRQEVIDSKATLVVRPDSGEPVAMVRAVIEMLGEKFGHDLNSKGFKVLKNVRVIQGDGLDGPEDIRAILLNLEMHGWSADNVAFGMGGGLLQKCNRDDLGFAMKCSAARVGDEWRDVFKDPITASSKKSKRGRLTALYDTKQYRYMTDTIDTLGLIEGIEDAMQTVYENGRFFNQTTMQEVRQRTGLW